MTQIPYKDGICGTTVKVVKILASLVRPISDRFSFAMSSSETDFVTGNCSNYLMDMRDRGFVSTLAWNCARTTNTMRRQDLLP